MRKSILMLSLFLVSLCAITIVRAGTWQDYLREAHQLFADKRHEQAQKLLYLTRDLAWQEGSWLGSVEAGLGFATLRDESEARRSYIVSAELLLY